MQLKRIIFISAVAISAISTAMASTSAKNFNCPDPSAIQSTDFTSPSIWIAPPVQHSARNVVGVGLGGKQVKEFLGVEPAIVGHRDGWVCVYRSEGGVSIREYEAKIMEIVSSNVYLKKQAKKVEKAFKEAEPYLSKYPQTTPVGFIGYQKEADDDLNN